MRTANAPGRGVFKGRLYVLFKIEESRGSKVLMEVLGKGFNGVLGCNYFSAYCKYMKDCGVSVEFLITLPDAEARRYAQRLLAG
jgi:hypothetical protein